jgi:drug/metabolite transporter (DMT)-like permease
MPKQVRGSFVARCALAMTSNVAYLLSMNFISFSEATIIFWCNPVFTAIGARYYLGEHLTNYDWIACFLAFFGILMIQNPFSKDMGITTSFEDHLIGTIIALIGAFLSSGTQLTIRMIGKHQGSHFMIVPVGFSLGHLMLCPLFLSAKLSFQPLDPLN